MTIHKYQCSWDMACDRCNCFFHFGLYLSLLPSPTPHLLPSPTAPKMKISKKWKKTPGDIIILRKCIKIMIICFTVPEIWWVMDVIAIFHFRLFFALLPPNSLKNENFKQKKKKWKKTGDIIILNSNLSSPRALSPNTWKKPENFWKSIPKNKIKVKKKSNCGKLQQFTQIWHLPTIFHSISKYHV